MKRRPWVIPPVLLLAIAGALSLYSILAEHWDFDLVVLVGHGASRLNHRLGECFLLWPILCVTVGWVSYFLGHRPPRNARVFPVMIPLLLITVWLSFPGARELWELFTQAMNTSPSTLSSSIRFELLVSRTLFPVFGFLGCWLFLYMQSRRWRLPFQPGVCVLCGYNLKGNTSGVCPECGTQVVEDPDVPARYYRNRYRWLPELSEFPDPRARYEAGKQASRALRRSKIFALLYVGLFIAAIPILFLGEECGKGYWRVLCNCFIAMSVIAMTLLARHIMRRNLRQQLEQRKKDSTP